MSPNLDDLGGVVKAEANLLCFLGLGGGARRLQRWDLQVVDGHRLGIGDHTGHRMEWSVASVRVRLSVSQA